MYLINTACNVVHLSHKIFILINLLNNTDFISLKCTANTHNVDLIPCYVQFIYRYT